jgi:hypothetical protein
MSYTSTVIYPMPLQSIDGSTISVTYSPLGGPLPEEARILKIVNVSNQDVTVSWDGVHDHDYIPSDSFTIYDFTTNKSRDTQISVAQKGTQLYVKGPTSTGFIFLVTFFGLGPTQTPPL